MTRLPPAPLPAPRRPGPPARLARAGLALFGLTLGAGACLDRPVAPASPRTSNAIAEQVAIERINKIDLLFLIDNSISMADKQAILAKAVPDLLKRLITPNCVKADGTTDPPDATTGQCPSDAAPEFAPVGDIHIGVVSSSLGGHGGTVCTPEERGFPNDNGVLLARSSPGAAPGAPVPTYKNQGFLAWDQTGNDADAISVRTTLETSFTSIVSGVGQNGCGLEASLEGWYRFLVDPSPPVIEPTPKDPTDAAGVRRTPTLPAPKQVDQNVLNQRADFLRPDSLVAIIALSDENDCSFIDGFYPGRTRGESGLVEEWPETYRRHLVVGAGPGAQTFALNHFQLNINQDGFLNSGTAACATNPYSPECYNCDYLPDEAARKAAGCADFSASPDAGEARRQYDRVNQRCFDQRRRFGYDALHPVQRYVDALTQRKVYDTSGAVIALNKPAGEAADARYFSNDDATNRDINNIVAPKVDNPLFVDLAWRRYDASCTGEGAARTCNEALKPAGQDSERRGRPDGRIYFAAIVGVPWQDIALNKDTLAPSGTNPGGFKATLSPTDWDLILGRPLELVPPKDPLMRESIEPRITADSPDKLHPVTGDDLSAPWNRINGHEWNSVIRDDLQYACIFPLTADVACNGDPAPEACDCTQTTAPETAPDLRKNPLCESYAPGDERNKTGTGTFTTNQARAKAYPGLRFLEVLKGIGDSAIVASICPEESNNDAAPNFGYRPAVNAIIERLKNALKGRCLPRRLDVQGTQTPCLIVEAKFERADDGTQPGNPTAIDACKACDAPGYAKLSPELLATLQGQPVANYDCLCEFRQLQPGAGLETCQTDSRDPAEISGVNGWCYVDPSVPPSDPTLTPEQVNTILGQQREIVKSCPADAQRTLRFIGTQGAVGDTTEETSLFITCLGAASNSTPATPAAAGAVSN